MICKPTIALIKRMKMISRCKLQFKKMNNNLTRIQNQKKHLVKIKILIKREIWKSQLSKKMMKRILRTSLKLTLKRAMSMFLMVIKIMEKRTNKNK